MDTLGMVFWILQRGVDGTLGRRSLWNLHCVVISVMQTWSIHGTEGRAVWNSGGIGLLALCCILGILQMLNVLIQMTATRVRRVSQVRRGMGRIRLCV